MATSAEFRCRKEVVLKALESDQKDRSRKGAVDAPIADLIKLINSHPSFFTTSSCSGRVSMFLEQSTAKLKSDPYHSGTDGNEDRARIKKGGEWIYVSHDQAAVDEVVLVVQKLHADETRKGLMVFRFEPFILALECSSLEAARQLMICAMSSGHRESGMSSVGKRIVVAVRSSIRLEVPIGENGQLLVSENYLKYLTASANAKFDLNQRKTEKFLFTFIERMNHQKSLLIDAISEKASDTLFNYRKRRRFNSDLRNKLLASLEERQSNILSKINDLEVYLGFEPWSSADQKLPKAAGLDQSDMCSLQTDGAVVSGALSERLLRWGHSACSMGEHSIVVYGGYGGPGRHARLNDILELNIADGSVRSVQTIGTPAPMMAHTATRVGDDMVVIGGRRSPACVLGTVSVFNLKELQWLFPKVTGAIFRPRHRHAAAAVGSKIFVHGGLDGSEIFRDLHVLDTASWTWTKLNCQGVLPSARHSHSLVAVGGKLYLFGGREGNEVYGDLHVLNLETCVWSMPAVKGVSPTPRFSHTMTLVNSYVVIIGGCPITRHGSYMVYLDVANMQWVRNSVHWPSDNLLIRHTTTLIDNALIIVGGGAACFAFGTTFSPTFLLDLEPIIHDTKYPEIDTEFLGEHSDELPKYATSTGKRGIANWVLKVEKNKAKYFKDTLKRMQFLDQSRKPEVLHDGADVAFPVTSALIRHLHTRDIAEQSSFPSKCSTIVEAGRCGNCEALQWLHRNGGQLLDLQVEPKSKRQSSPQLLLRKSVGMLLQQSELPDSLLKELPTRWERLEDMIILRADSFCGPIWSSLGDELWRTVANALGGKRVARQDRIAPTGTRDSRLQVLYGGDGWVQHRENGILYCFNATKCMFSSGNVSEKLRVAKLQCKGTTVVDLFAGIGYYVLPFLLKAGAQKVYACEWNKHAIAALRHNLRVNGVEDKCEVIEGDNRVMAPQGVADMVSLGLLPSSEASWPVAVRALKPEGGVLLVHENVKDTDEKAWIDHLLTSMADLAASLGRMWEIKVIHFHRVKWYAPHICHVVADLQCSAAAHLVGWNRVQVENPRPNTEFVSSKKFLPVDS